MKHSRPQYMNIRPHMNPLCFVPAASVLLLIFFLLLCGCGSQSVPLSRTGFFFDTVIGITLYDSDSEELLDECFSLAAKYENMLSKTKENSDLWNINHARGASVTVSDDTIAVLNAALSYAALSEGAVDPTIGSVNKLWSFTDESNASGIPSHLIPAPDRLQKALSHVDYRCISISGTSVTLSDPEAELDLGFIAKGYIADRIKAYLVSEGVKSAIINLGGNVLTIGHKPDGTSFHVGIKQPFSDDGTTAFTLAADDISIVSSGIYERFFKADGIIYHHILDTKTGYPIQNNLFQVTIISASSTDADALSTLCFALGLEKGMALAESLTDTEAVFITSDGSLHSTSGITLSPQ